MFDKLKETLIKRIEENSVKSELSYKDRDGNLQTEIVYLKRGKGKNGDWHEAYLPVKDEISEDGKRKWNVANALFGGRRNLIKLLIYLAIFGFFIYSIKEAYNNYNTIANLPCVQACLQRIGYG